MKKETTLKRKELSVLEGLILQELYLLGQNAYWHIAKNVQILSELRPKKLLLPATNQNVCLEAVGAMPVYTLGIEPFKSVLEDFILIGCTSRLF